MNSHNEIHVKQILYTKDGAPVIVVGKTNGEIIVEYKNTRYKRDISIIGDKLFVKPPCLENGSQKTQIVKTSDARSSISQLSAPQPNRTEALIREIIYDAKMKPHKKASQALPISNTVKLKGDCDNVAKTEHHVQQEPKLYDYRGNYIKTIRTSEAICPHVKGSWMSDYQPPKVSNAENDSGEGLNRSSVFSRDTKVLGRNSAYADIRPSTLSGYSQESKRPLISKRRKRS